MWPFRPRRPALPPTFRQAPDPRLSDRWCAGDLAECLITGPWYTEGRPPAADGPVFQEVRRVRNVYLRRHPLTGDLVEALLLEGWPGCVYAAHCFRKITPRADAAERGDTAFIAALRKRLRRAPAPAHPEPVEAEPMP